MYKRRRGGSYTYDAPVQRQSMQRQPQRRTKLRLYRAPSSRRGGVYTFRRQIQQSMTVNQSLGWFSGGQDMCFSPSLAACDIRLNGVSVFSTPLPSVGEFTALFDQYKITKVTVRLIFSCNSSDTVTPSIALPVVHQCNDYNSTAALSLSEYQQYPSLKTWQLGQDKVIQWSFVPHVRGDVLNTSGVASTSAHNIPCPWLDTSSTNVEMLGSRLYLNNLGRATNVDIGNALFMITYDMAFKFVK